MADLSKDTFFKLLDATLDFSIDFIENGTITRIGSTRHGEASYSLKINDPAFYRAVLSYGNLGLGESFMRGGFEMVKGSLEGLIEALLACRLDRKLKRDLALAMKIFPFRTLGLLRSKKSNVQGHYDAGLDLFSAFLDPTLTYSCGYAEKESDDLEQLQQNKFERICRKLDLKPGDRLLDIGCGFGGMLLYAASRYSIQGLGITNSKDHYQTGNDRIRQAGLNHQVRIEMMDFTRASGSYDKVVSIGMLEHVPPGEYDHYFKTIHRLLNENGRGLVHFVGANAAANDHDYFIQKYIFPMSHQPRLSVITANLERHGLAILDVENMVRHYGFTARHWLHNFRKNRSGLSRYSASFLNMFEYYLACCVAAARASDAALYQVLFMKNYMGNIPLRRV